MGSTTPDQPSCRVDSRQDSFSPDDNNFSVFFRVDQSTVKLGRPRHPPSGPHVARSVTYPVRFAPHPEDVVVFGRFDWVYWPRADGFSVRFCVLASLGALKLVLICALAFCSMAANLIKDGQDVVVFDMFPASVEAAVKQGARSASSISELSSQCSSIITMLPAAKQVQDVYLGAGDGILANCDPSVLLIDCSTVEASVAAKVAGEAKSRGVTMCDAPVSGGVGGAAAGTLSFMVGGTDDGFTRAEKILKPMGKNIVHCGAAGAGQVAKICNNLVLGISMVGLNEGYNLALQHGLEPEKIANIFNTSSAQSWSSNYVGPPGTKDYSTGFKVALMSKDLGLAMSAAADSSVPLPLGSKANEIYAELSKINEGEFADKDFSVVLEYLRSLNGK